jgi:hypothetical protein
LACNIERRDMADEGGDAESITEPPSPGKSLDGPQKFEIIPIPCGLDKHN